MTVTRLHGLATRRLADQDILDGLDREGLFPALCPGATVRFNHASCSAGVDTKRRLYVTCPTSEPTVLLAYCHNCQQSRRLFNVPGLNETFRGTKWKAKSSDSIEPLKHTVSPKVDWIDLPTDVRIFLLSKNVTKPKYSRWPITYNTDKHAIEYILPNEVILNTKDMNYEQEGQVNYQFRPLHSSPNGAKYLTCKTTKDEMKTFVYQTDTHSQKGIHIVVVEDILSALVVAEQNPSVVAVANFGVQVSPVALQIPNPDIAVLPVDNVSIWLDNDNEQVRNAAQTYGKLAKMVYPKAKVNVVENEADPKNCLRRIIQRQLKLPGMPWTFEETE